MAQFTESQRESLSEENLAMPDGSYPIRNRQDLKNAIASYGRTKHPEKVKRWIIKRARDLNATDLIPDSWGTDSVSHSLYLRHYGVKGMKWGVRKSDTGASWGTRRKAKKDAKETARAKMYYGEGAGNRRKLIKAKVANRRKDLKGYSEEYDRALAKQDPNRHLNAARRERRTANAKKAAGKNARGIYRLATGQGTRNVAFSAAVLFAAGSGAYKVAKATGYDRKVKAKVAPYAKQAASQATEWAKQKAR